MQLKRAAVKLALPVFGAWLAIAALAAPGCGDSGSGGGGNGGTDAGGAPELSCGDGFADPDLGEACDDGNFDEADDCLNDCTLPKCGDSIVHLGYEECDDGNEDDTDGCTSVCFLAVCGDGFTQAGVEDCDDGNEEDGDACGTTCSSGAGCGNSVVDADEACDDGNNDNSDGCTTACEIATCGDGYAELGVEDCDDGNDVNGDACSNTCTINVPTNYDCPGTSVGLGALSDITLGGDTALASPTYSGDCGGYDAPEVVYALTPEVSGLLMLDMLAINSDLDPILYVKASCDDGPSIACADLTFAGGDETLSLAVDGGTTYYVFADGWDTGAGEYLLSATLLTSVPGDECPGVNIPLAGFNAPYQVSGDTSAANADRRGLGLCGSHATPDIVYQITAPETGDLVAALDPSYDASLYVRSNCTSQASELVCEESGLSGVPEVAVVPVVAGNTYYVIVDGWEGDAGPYNLELTLIP